MVRRRLRTTCPLSFRAIYTHYNEGGVLREGNGEGISYSSHSFPRSQNKKSTRLLILSFFAYFTYCIMKVILIFKKGGFIMHYEKAETVRIEIMEGMSEDSASTRSIFILLCMFIGYFIKNLCRLFKVFFKGLWCFIKYGYYRLMAWFDKKEEEVYER